MILQILLTDCIYGNFRYFT